MSTEPEGPRPATVALMMLLGGRPRAEVSAYLLAATMREAARG